MSWYERPYAGGGFGGGGRFADNPLGWSPTVGRVFGIRVRVHMLFILYVLFELLSAEYGLGFRALYLAALFGSVFVHELGHCFACRAVGGRADDVLMWPLGGLAMVDPPRTVRAEFVTVACGPLVSLGLALLGWVLLRVGADRAWASLNPFAAWGVAGDGLLSASTLLWLLYRVNWGLFLFNLVPMYPMDGGRLLQCAVWTRLGQRRSVAIATAVGMVAAVAMGLAGLTTANYTLVAIAVMGYLTCYQERAHAAHGGSLAEPEFGYAGGGGPADDTGVGRRRGWLARWRERRAEERRRRRAALETAEQAEVDRILEKVHEHGLASLSRIERRTLEEASRRQRESSKI